MTQCMVHKFKSQYTYMGLHGRYDDWKGAGQVWRGRLQEDFAQAPVFLVQRHREASLS